MYDNVYIPFVEKDYLRRALWASLPVAERLPSWTKPSICLWCGVVQSGVSET